VTIALQVQNELGIHARPAQHIVKIAARHKAEFFLEKDGNRVNGKSIMGVLMLAAEQGSTVTLTADGEGAEELLREIEALFNAHFYEQ
jgi:phosphocarrier protein